MKIIRESLVLEAEEKTIELSAGLVIIQDGNILLGHPTGQKWQGSFSIPKGRVEEGEDLLEAAIRETSEEVGINIDKKDIEDTEPLYIDYKDKKGVPYKRVYYFIVKPKIPISSEAIIPDKKEIDWAAFLTKEAASDRIFWKLKPILDHIDNKEDKTTEPEEDLDLGL